MSRGCQRFCDKIFEKLEDQSFSSVWLWATNMSAKKSFQIKTLNNNHTCVRDYNATTVTSSWLAKEYARKLRDNLTMKFRKMQSDVKDTYGIIVTYNQCFRANRKQWEKLRKI